MKILNAMRFLLNLVSLNVFDFTNMKLLISKFVYRKYVPSVT